MPREQSDICEYKEGVMETIRRRRKSFVGPQRSPCLSACRCAGRACDIFRDADLTVRSSTTSTRSLCRALLYFGKFGSQLLLLAWNNGNPPQQDVPIETREVCLPTARTYSPPYT